MQKKDVSVLGVSEVRWKGQDETRSGDYTVYNSGGERAERSVAIVVHKSLVRSVVKATFEGGSTAWPLEHPARRTLMLPTVHRFSKETNNAFQCH